MVASVRLKSVYGTGFALLAFPMELTTILNRCQHFRGLVYEQARFSADKKSIGVVTRPRKVRPQSALAAICRV